MINVYLLKATTEQLELIKNILEAVDIKEFNIVQLNKSSPTVASNDLCLVFGEIAYNLIKNTNPTAIKLPSIDKLVKKPGNEGSRESAWSILKSAFIDKTITPQTLLLEKEDLKELDVNKLSNNNWIGTTSSGKQIVISNQKDDNPNVYHLTFEELIVAKLAFDILGLKSLTLGTKND